MTKNIKHFITLFFVTLFLVFKVAGLHALSHHDDDSDVQHCEVCHISAAINFIPLLNGENTVLEDVEYFFAEQKINDNSIFVTYSNRHISNFLFTRPPPHLL